MSMAERVVVTMLAESEGEVKTLHPSNTENNMSKLTQRVSLIYLMHDKRMLRRAEGGGGKGAAEKGEGQAEYRQ